jgi:hypothetical protein
MNEKKIALLVVSDDYSATQFKPLKAPKGDGEKLANVLTNTSIGGYNVQLIINEPHYKVLGKIEATLKQCGRNDLVVLYFSGHGIKDDRGQLFFATTNTNTELLTATAISATIINELIARCRSRRKVLLLDTCYSGAFAKGTTHKAGEHVDVRSFFEQGTGHVVMTATDAMQYAFEEDGVSGESKGSVFTSTIVEGLRTGMADVDGDGQVSFDDLYDFVRNQVSGKRPEQQPHKWLFGVEGKLILAKNPNPKPRELPEDVKNALKNPIPSVVKGAIPVLARMLDHPNRGIMLSARHALETLTEHDSRAVSADAIIALGKENSKATRPIAHRNIPQPAPEIPKPITMAGTEAKPVYAQTKATLTDTQINAKWISLVVMGMLSGIFNFWDLVNLSINLFPLQIWAGFVIGYRFPTRPAIIAGALIFLPNLFIHLVQISGTQSVGEGYYAIDGFKGTIFAGRAHISGLPIQCRTLGFGYFFYAFFPMAVALVKEKIHQLKDSTTCLSPNKLILKNEAKFVRILCIVLLSISCGFGLLQFNGYYIVMAFMTLWVYKYGLEQTRTLLVFFVLTQLIQMRSDVFSMFETINSVDFPILLLIMIVCSSLTIVNQIPKRFLGFVLAMPLICFFFSFYFRISPGFAVELSCVALPLIFFLGYKYGSRLGFTAGVIWGCTAAVHISISDAISWGAINTDYVLGASFIGYLGGTDMIRRDFLPAAFKLLGTYYGAVFLASVSYGGFYLPYRADDLMNYGFSLVMLLILSLFAQKSKKPA